MSTITIDKQKEDFIGQLHTIALGNQQLYDGATGQSAIKKILSSKNVMTAIVKYDALLSELKAQHNLRAKKFVPVLCELLEGADYNEKKIVRKILSDFKDIWSRATVYNYLPEKYKRDYTKKKPTPKSPDLDNSAKPEIRRLLFTLDKDVKAGTKVGITVNYNTGEVVGLEIV